GAAKHRRQRLEYLVDGHADEARLLTVEVDLHLWIARIEGGEHVADLGPLAGGLLKLTAQVTELLDAERSASILEKEIEPRGGAEAGDRRNVEGEDDRLRDLGKLFREARHDAGDVQLRRVTLFPRLEAHEQRAEVRLIRRGDEAITTDRLE